MSISALFMALALAQSTAASPGPEARPSEAEMTVAAFSESFGVSQDEARKRIEAGEAIDQYVESLRERYKSRLTFISIEQSPDQHIVVGLKGPQMVPTQRMSEEGATVRVEFEEGYPYDQAEFRTIVQNSLKEAKKLIPGITGMEGRPELGTIRIHVQDRSDNGHSKAAAKLGQMFGVKFEIVYGQGRSTNAAYTRGGAILQSNGRTCTSGLAVKHKVTNEKGIITAAHCEDNLLYSNYGQPGGTSQVLIPLIFRAASFDGSHDVQWHALPSGHSPLQEVFGTLTSESGGRILTLIYNELPINKPMCFRGARTGYSCGKVTSVEWIPAGTCGAVECDATWARVEGSALACASGDSGAAVFYINSGYGIVKSVLNPTDSTLAGDCGSLTVMPFGRVAELDLVRL
ncbi:hypothetical protein [Stenotrophomonas sp. PS02289]|uniref:hypothetical protein n=1 Tax=Stenotrophomonas sp. PS02289 TaxID=2991422 RepID=UPI00249CB078|nr:hypothetical protein [Stenotrophomonas sp. PS02289]